MIFFYLFGSSDEFVPEWMLLPITLTCECVVNGNKCESLMTLKSRRQLFNNSLTVNSAYIKKFRSEIISRQMSTSQMSTNRHCCFKYAVLGPQR